MVSLLWFDAVRHIFASLARMRKAVLSRLRLGSIAVNKAIDLPGSHAFREEARVRNPACKYKDGTGQDAQIKNSVHAYKDGTGPRSYIKYVQA